MCDRTELTESPRWPDSCYLCRIVVRSAHRTRLAKFVAVCLFAFSVSPVTAPFTTCDLSDFTHPHQTDTGHHPGRQMAEAHVKTARHLVTITFELRLAPSVTCSRATPRDRRRRRSGTQPPRSAHRSSVVSLSPSLFPFQFNSDGVIGRSVVRAANVRL